MIAERLNQAYAAQGLREQAERPFKFGPSSLGKCLREQAHLLAGMQPAPLAPEQLRTFELGHQRGERLEALCKEIWPDAQSQVPIRIPIGAFEIKGTADLWIPSLRTVVDFKTVGAYGAGLLSGEGVSEDYKLQVHAYRDGIARAEAEGYADFADVRAADDEYAKHDITRASDIRAVILYECKDSDARKGIKGGQLIEMEVPWTQELEDRYQARLREIEGMLIRHKQGTLDPTNYPELPLEKGKHSWKCRYCSIGEERGGCYKK